MLHPGLQHQPERYQIHAANQDGRARSLFLGHVVWGLPGPELVATTPLYRGLANHYSIGLTPLRPLSQMVVTDDTGDATFGKLLRRQYVWGTFPN
jgi:hypothetical protein